jgi:hypothetical protein
MRASWKSVTSTLAKDMKEAEAEAGLAMETECKMGSRARQYILPRMCSRLYNRIDGGSVGRYPANLLVFPRRRRSVEAGTGRDKVGNGGTQEAGMIGTVGRQRRSRRRICTVQSRRPDGR